MADINQDDIDKLLADAMGGDVADVPSGSGGVADAPAEPEEPTDSGPASQNDIDALFASIGGDSSLQPEPSAPAPAAPPPEKKEEAPADGTLGQDDINALFDNPASDGKEEALPPPSSPLGDLEQALAAADSEAADKGMPGQNDIDELFASIVSGPPPEQAGDSSPSDTVHVDTEEMSALLEKLQTQTVPPAAPEESPAASAQAGKPEPVPPAAPPAVEEPIPPPSVEPPPAPPAVEPSLPPPLAGPAPAPAVPEISRVAPPPAAPVSAPQPFAAESMRETLSLFAGAGEVEGIAGQIASLLGQLSEKARRFMQAWTASEQEAKELRTLLAAEGHRLAVVSSEKEAMLKEFEALRRRVGQMEGEKLGAEEARRTADAAVQAKAREQESRIAMLTSETETLKDELTRARNQATGIDIESRRARFEADRLRNEVESERMERLRMQRALENREKEIQAMQAQSSGQASTLFLDELHRLVRRLENELDLRTSGAHEALAQLDKLDVPETMVPVASNLRAAILRALGNDADGDDALKSLSRDAGKIPGPQAVAPSRTDVAAFETAISTYNLENALELAGQLLRNSQATPASLMRRVYQCPALRRQEISERLPVLTRLLDGLRTVQESGDRARGKEGTESEVFYAQMFDFLHNLVRLKLVTRMSGDIWRIFLDLRGRFSFITSDRQWAEYRDGILAPKN